MVFHHHFLREGVIEAVCQMASSGCEGYHMPLESQRAMGQDEHGGSMEPPLRARLALRAVAFREAYFEECSGNSTSTTTEAMQQLTALAQQIAAHAETPGELGAGTLQGLCELLTEGEGVSTFELLGSGIVDALLAYLHPNNEDVEARVGTFTDVLLSATRAPGNPAASSPAKVKAPILVLTRLLSSSVGKLEDFEVTLHPGVTNLVSGLKVLTQPFKLRLSLEDGDNATGLKDYSSNVVLIEPLATISAVEEFLWSKVSKSGDDSGGAPMGEDEDDDEEEAEEPGTPRQGIQQPGGRLTLCMGGEQLNHKTTIFQAIHHYRSVQNDEEDAEEGRGGEEMRAISKWAWETVHTIMYRQKSEMDDTFPASPHLIGLKKAKGSRTVYLNAKKLSCNLLSTGEYYPAPSSAQLCSTLSFLSILHTISLHWFHVASKKTVAAIAPEGVDARAGSGAAIIPEHTFVNAKLTNKIMRQLQDPLNTNPIMQQL